MTEIWGYGGNLSWTTGGAGQHHKMEAAAILPAAGERLSRVYKFWRGRPLKQKYQPVTTAIVQNLYLPQAGKFCLTPSLSFRAQVENMMWLQQLAVHLIRYKPYNAQESWGHWHPIPGNRQCQNLLGPPSNRHSVRSAPERHTTCQHCSHSETWPKPQWTAHSQPSWSAFGQAAG